MALTTDPTGKAAPSGGFQTGGWYSGYQYWNGSFASKAGQVHQDNPNQGGTMVSSATNQASSVAQGKDPGAIDAYLAKVNNTVYQNENSTAPNPSVSSNPTGSSPDLQSLKDQITGGATPPTPPDLAGDFSKLQTTFNLSGPNGLISKQAALQTQIDAANTKLQTQKNTEENTPGLTLDVVAGRETEEQRQAQITLDSLNLQMNTLTNQINSANASISTIMQFTQQDFQNAETSYNDQVTTNMNIYNAFETTLSNEQKIAASNVGVYANLISSGNMNYNSMTPSQKASLNTMEVQAGLPSGFLSSIHSDLQNGKLVYAGAKGYLMQTQDANGNSSFNWNAIAGGTGGGGTASDTAAAKSEMTDQIVNGQSFTGSGPMLGEDQFISPSDWNQLLQQWTDAGMAQNKFIAYYAKYANPKQSGYNGL